MIINSYASTAQAIKAPFTFYYANDWNNSHNFQFWNKNFSTDSDPGITNKSTQKTIYDPSVSGFTLPKTAAFTNFSSSGYDTTNGGEFNVSGSFKKGWNFYVNGWRTGSTIFFHALGYRETGAVVLFGGEGDYWINGASSASNARCLVFYPDGVQPQVSYYRSYGFVVRPSLEN